MKDDKREVSHPAIFMPLLAGICLFEHFRKSRGLLHKIRFAKLVSEMHHFESISPIVGLREWPENHFWRLSGHFCCVQLENRMRNRPKSTH